MHKIDMRKTLFPTNLTLQCGITLQFKKKKKKNSWLLISQTLKEVQGACYNQKEKFFKIAWDPNMEYGLL